MSSAEFWASLGAVFDADGEVQHFGDAAAEFRALRNGLGFADVSHFVELRMTGDDRASWLHNFCTNDIKSLAPGDTCEAFLTNVKARVIGHGLISAFDDCLTLLAAPGSAETLLAHLDRYIITEDVQLHDDTASRSRLMLTNFASAAVSELLSAAGADQVRVSAPAFPDPSCTLLSCLPNSMEPILRAAHSAGAVPAGQQAFEAARIDAGWPLLGCDMSEEHLAPEVDRSRNAISYVKGCYLGQEPIARLDALGQVNRMLCRVIIDGRDNADTAADDTVGPGSEILAEDQVVGTLTSVAAMADGASVALAWLKRTARSSSLTVAGQAVRLRDEVTA